ncbi:MAG: hypothetical protein E6J77_06315 [Deltaproteobacteria bacterium]|nr:MAG: hypothetical protein E6J77_06315 [Deltaproteobacteria bacterium]
MLRTLRVRDLAIIDELEVVLEPGLNVITGETGAGKSILLQALDVALGGRPDADLVRSGADEGAVEALFTVVPATVRELLAAAGIPEQGQGGELIVRRVIAQGGRTRAYVNGALGSLPLLHELAPHLLRVYGQDEHQALRRVESHRELLDAIGGLGSRAAGAGARRGRARRGGRALGAARRAAPGARAGGAHGGRGGGARRRAGAAGARGAPRCPHHRRRGGGVLGRGRGQREPRASARFPA